MEKIMAFRFLEHRLVVGFQFLIHRATTQAFPTAKALGDVIKRQHSI